MGTRGLVSRVLWLIDIRLLEVSIKGADSLQYALGTVSVSSTMLYRGL